MKCERRVEVEVDYGDWGRLHYVFFELERELLEVCEGMRGQMDQASKALGGLKWAGGRLSEVESWRGRYGTRVDCLGILRCLEMGQEALERGDYGAALEFVERAGVVGDEALQTARVKESEKVVHARNFDDLRVMGLKGERGRWSFESVEGVGGGFLEE